MPIQLDDVMQRPDFAADPYPYYRELREGDPVQWSNRWNCWVITPYDKVRDCLQDYRRFSNVGRVTGHFHRHFSASELEYLHPLIHHYSQGLINVDPPDHTRIRRLMHDVFRPSMIARLADSVRAFVADLLGRRKAADRIDVVGELAHPLPVHVIAELFGVSHAEVPLFIGWSAGIVDFMKSPEPEFSACVRSQGHLLDMRAFVSAGIAERRRQSRDDILSHMANARIEGDSLTEDEILGTSVSLLTGGHETTTRLITNSVVELLQNPELQTRLRQEPGLMDTAADEFLRFCGPFHRDQRVALVDTELGDKTIRKGDYILLMLAAANRDPLQFLHPDTFDPARKPNRHLAFGFGPHGCIGAPLARLELAAALSALLQSRGNLRLLTEPLDWEFGFLRSPRKLAIAFDPVRG